MFAKGKNIQQFHSVFSSILVSGRWGCVGYVLVLRGRVYGVVVLRRWGWGLVFWGCLVGVRRGHWSRIHWLSSTIGKPAIVGWRWWGIYIRDIIGHAHSGLYDSTSDPSRFTFTDNNTDEHDDSDDDCQCEQPPYHRPGDRPHRAIIVIVVVVVTSVSGVVVGVVAVGGRSHGGIQW